MLDLTKLNKKQLEAVQDINGPLLILAGAGTGKTLTMTYRAGYMIEQGIAPEHILMLTFTNKAAREMKERLGKYLDKEKADKVTASTFHSFCVTLLRRYGKKIGLQPNFTVLSESDDDDVISIVKSSDDRKKYQGKGFPSNAKLRGFISAAVNKNLSISEVMKGTRYEPFVVDVIEIGQKAEAYKMANNMVNYDDLLLRVIEILENHTDVTKDIAERYTHIMVDEYQDTNPLQDTILRKLFEYTQNIAVVGDDMQSLYGFRGAEVENIITFPDRFSGCDIIQLDENYRSSQEILDVANVVMDCASEGFPKKLHSNLPSSKKPAVVSTRDQHEEADYVFRLIQRLISDGENPSEICVVERNSILSAELEIALNRAGIEFDKYGGLKFTELAYVRDILAYLKLVLNPRDEISAFRILKVHRGIGDVYARNIADNMKNNGLSALVDPSLRKRVYASELKRLFEQMEFVEGLDLTKMVESFVEFYSSTKKQNIETMDTDEGNRTALLLANELERNELYQLVEISKGYKKIDTFLDDLLLDNTKIDEKDRSSEHIVISTVHSVKGLEFKHVIILDCLDGIFPSTVEEETQEDNDELRCFYVAVTRAKTNLFIMCPESGLRYGVPVSGVPSHYLKEAKGLIRSNDKNFFQRFERKLQYQPYNFRRKNTWK